MKSFLSESGKNKNSQRILLSIWSKSEKFGFTGSFLGGVFTDKNIIGHSTEVKVDNSGQHSLEMMLGINKGKKLEENLKKSKELAKDEIVSQNESISKT